MHLGPNRSYIMVFIAGVAALAMAVLLSERGYLLSGKPEPIPHETQK